MRYLNGGQKTRVWLFKDDIKVKFAAILLIQLTFSLLVSGTSSKFSCLCWALLAVPQHSCLTLDMTDVRGATWKALRGPPALGSGAALSSGLAGEPLLGWSWCLTCWLHFWMHLSISPEVCLNRWAGHCHRTVFGVLGGCAFEEQPTLASPWHSGPLVLGILTCANSTLTVTCCRDRAMELLISS